MRLPRFLLSMFLPALLPLVSCGHPERPVGKGAASPAGPAAPVETYRVGSSGHGSIEVPGTVESARTASLASRFPAVIEQLGVQEGDFVHRGDLLARLDARDATARIDAAEAAHLAARARRDRIRALFAKEAATQQELEAAEAEDSASAAALDAAKAQLDYLNIKAPFDGWIAQKRASAGDFASSGQPLLVLQGAGLLRVTATVSQRQAEALAPGQMLDAVLDDGSVVSARVVVLGAAGDPSSRRFLVKADLQERTQARSGSFARLKLPAVEGETSLVAVPRTALIERGALTGLFVVEEGRARLRWISPGEPSGDLITVRAGLAAGEEIVLDPGMLADGDAVAPAATGTTP